MSKNEVKNMEKKQAVQFDSDIYSQGFGMIAQLVMRDPRLTPGAKGFYAYICSFAGAGKSAFPSRETICQEMNVNKNTYWGWCLELRKYGYIKIITRPEENLSNIFVILSSPEPDNTIQTLSERRKEKNKSDTGIKPRPKISDEGASLKISDEPRPKISDEPRLKISDGDNKHIKVTLKNNNMDKLNISNVNQTNNTDVSTSTDYGKSVIGENAADAKRTLKELNKVLKENNLSEITKTKKAERAINDLLALDDYSLNNLILNCILLQTADEKHDVTLVSPIAFILTHPETIPLIVTGKFPRKPKKQHNKKKKTTDTNYEIYVPPSSKD